MKHIVLTAFLTLLVLAPISDSSAQLVAAKDGPIVYGHHHLNVTSADEHKKFWVDALGGVPTRIGTNNLEIVKFPNALLFMRAQKPSGGTKGSTLDHIGFSVPSLPPVIDRIKAGGFRMVTASEAPANVPVKGDIGVVEGGGPVTGIAYALGPDDVKVELVEMKAQMTPVASHHLHFFGAQAEMHAWYMKIFGATTVASANPAFLTARLPGLGMNFTATKEPVAGTQGRALDHIGFEVKNLEAFTKKLESQGIKLAVAYRQVPALGIGIAFMTDPWGTYIELTEGLDKIN
jgi:predicted enzyme related to lactoylglutathione lyase/catechol 2,3-dioxygenase-like lactoylglutathione lyase family enzyme